MKVRLVLTFLLLACLAGCGAKDLPKSSHGTVSSSAAQLSNAAPKVGDTVTFQVTVPNASSYTYGHRIDLEVKQADEWRTVGYLVPADAGYQKTFVPVGDTEIAYKAGGIFADSLTALRMPDVKAGRYRIVVMLNGHESRGTMTVASEFDLKK